MPSPVPAASDAAAFARGAPAYGAFLESPHGQVRLEIIWRQVTALVEGMRAGRQAPLEVLDVGCGTGEVALRLAARGHSVTLLDPAPEMLELVERGSSRLDPPPAVPPRLVRASAEDAPDLFGPRRFDLLLCHNVLEYLADGRGAVAALGALLARGGRLSLVALNRWQAPFRLAVRDASFEEAAAAVAGAATTDSLFGLPRKGMAVDELRAVLGAAGIEVVGFEGVLVFADYVPPAALADPATFAALLRLEVAAAGRSPFRDVARHCHVLGRRAG